MYTSMLELAISMILLYLLLSAASSAIQEIIANLLRWRASTLEKGIAGLLQDEKFRDELYHLPLISGLCSPNARGQLRHKPSYIPPATFALAVLQLAEQRNLLGAAGAAPPATGGRAGAVLQSLLRGATSVEDQKKRLEDWFNDSMDRVSGWYKRRANVALWIIGAAVCLLANADSISLANTFWNDAALRSAMVTAATEYVRNPPKAANGGGAPSTPQTNNPKPAGGGTSNPQQPANKTAPGTDAGNPVKTQPTATDENNSSKSDKDAFARLDDMRTKLAKINVPLGWCWKTGDTTACFPNLSASDLSHLKTTAANTKETSSYEDPRLANDRDRDWWLLKILGLALTVLAISQGAPFWFDLLQRAVNLRLAGDAPDEKKKK